jgi:hypothetical protein
MTLQTCFDLENNDNVWLLAQRSEGKSTFLRQFKNTIDGINELSKFIKSRYEKPVIYIKSTGYPVLTPLQYLCRIPNIEVRFVSQAGFKEYQTCLPKNISPNSQETFFKAEMLAYCAGQLN